MAAAPKTNKQTSRWGFLSQAVASVEGRLDAILADEGDTSSRTATPAPGVVRENVPPSRDSTDSNQPTPTAQQNDRLQERLAKAMAKRNNTKRDPSASGSEQVSRADTPLDVSSQLSLDDRLSSEQTDEPGSKAEPPVIRVSEDESTISKPPLVGSERQSVEVPQPNNDKSMRSSMEESDSILLQAQLEHEESKSKMQEEIKGYVERIDALNAKLQYLAKETAQTSRTAVSAADSGSLERKIAEKDERIALLMEEGQKLSMTEMKHLLVIKKLRAEASTSLKDGDAVRQRALKAEKQVSVLMEKAKRAEQATKTAEDKASAFSKTSSDLEAVLRERNALKETMVDMRNQIAKANARAENAETKASAGKLEAEKKRITELQDDLVTAKIERELAEEKLKREIKDLRSAVEREKDHNRAMETEMLAEQAMLESKLETFRVRAEEASSKDQGDSEAKLLRQIETLQGQYAAASQNWQGIEGSLLSRIAAVEKERDEITTREADTRKRLRDASLRAKNASKELEETHLKFGALEEGRSDALAEVKHMTRRVQELEELLATTQKETEDQQLRLERDFARRMDEEKSKWAATLQHARTESPNMSMRKSVGHDMDHLMSPPLMDRPTSRRSSALPSHVSGAAPPSRQNSASSVRKVPNGIVDETPPIITALNEENDEYFAGVPATPFSEAPESVHPSRRGLNDMISASTMGVGPSVQLVERMSANVRRLETEKAASKDELARLTSQRDESRQEVVRLMREVEDKRKTEERLKSLETEHKTLAGRHQTTLEMLGEKSEQVEELKQDVADVKQMYRDLADQMK